MAEPDARPDGALRLAAILLGVLGVLGIVPGLFLGFMSIFLFDAPGSESSGPTLALALGLVLSPVVSLGVAVSGFLAARGRAKQRLLVVLGLFGGWALYMAAAYLALDTACGGNFAC